MRSSLSRHTCRPWRAQNGTREIVLWAFMDTGIRRTRRCRPQHTRAAKPCRHRGSYYLGIDTYTLKSVFSRCTFGLLEPHNSSLRRGAGNSVLLDPAVFGRDEPRASWSQKLLQSRNAVISEQFSRFELHEVHRISQTAHNPGTLNGGPIKTLLARDTICGRVSS
jgi:hypothetical protein